MNPTYKPIPTLFWHRFLFVIILMAGAWMGTKFLPKFFHPLYFMDPSLTFSLVLIVGIVAWYIFFRVVEKPFFMAMIPLMYLFWLILDKTMATVAVSVKPQVFALGFILFGGIVIFYKNLRYLWSFQIVKFLSIFVVINVIFYFFHSSDFNISRDGYIYGWQGSSGEKSAKFIVFLDSIIPLFAFCVPAALFAKINSMEEFKFYLHKMANVFFIGFLIYLLLSPITLRSMPTGKHIFFPLNLFFLISLKLFIDNNYVKNKWYNLCFTLILIALAFIAVLNANKTALIGFIFSLIFFMFVNANILKFKFNIVEIPKQKYLTPILVLASFILLYFLAEYFGVINIIAEKVTKTVKSLSGHSGISSFYIRQSNWKYFILNWTQNLNWFNLLFGFGLGASREAMFYISATQYSKIYFVQTTHNQFTEIFYDYGLVCLLFYIPLIVIFFKDVMIILSRNIDRLIKLFATSNLAMIFFFFIYHLTDGLRVETTIIFFSLIAFNEMVKHTLQRVQHNE